MQNRPDTRSRHSPVLAALALLCLLGSAACNGPWRTVVVNNVGGLGDFHPGDTRELFAVRALEQHRLFFTDWRLIFDSATQPDSFHWTSSDTTVATVDSLGVVLARRPGRFAVVVQSGPVRSKPAYYQVMPDPAN